MMILMYIVQAVQTVGDVSSTTMGGFGRDAKDTELGGAIKGQGICGMIGALIGGLPTDPFIQNVGLICTTKVVAKRVFVIVSAIMLLAGFCPQAHVFDRHRSATRTRRRYHHGLRGDHAVRYPAHFRAAAQLNRR